MVAPVQNITNNGYLYIYLSNQSKQDVYFDDLSVQHYSGPLLQEQSYYPFGLQMAGISSKAMNKLTTQHKFNGGVELEEDYGVNLYNTFYRQYDPQIGRFMGVDMLSEYTVGMTPYQFGNNNPISFNDPMGDIAQSDWNDMMNRVQTWDFGAHGGSYSSSRSGFSAFHSDAEAFTAGANHLDLFNLWGTNGFSNSLGDAQGLYYSNGGSDGLVRGVQPTIIIKGSYQNGNFITHKPSGTGMEIG